MILLCQFLQIIWTLPRLVCHLVNVLVMQLTQLITIAKIFTSDPQKNRQTHNDEQKNLFPQDDAIPPSSTSEDDDNEKKLNQKKIKRKISRFFRGKLEKQKDREGSGSHPQRPKTLSLDKNPEPLPTIVSPSKFLKYTFNLQIT